MSDTTSKKSEGQIICPCSGTRVHQIEFLLRNGVNDLDQISRKTGALSGCGGCEYDIRQLLSELQSET